MYWLKFKKYCFRFTIEIDYQIGYRLYSDDGMMMTDANKSIKLLQIQNTEMYMIIVRQKSNVLSNGQETQLHALQKLY